MSCIYKRVIKYVCVYCETSFPCLVLSMSPEHGLERMVCPECKHESFHIEEVRDIYVSKESKG